MMLDLSPAFDNTEKQVLIKRLKQQVSKSGPALEKFTLYFAYRSVSIATSTYKSS